MRMKPLILTSLHGLELEKSDLADVVVAVTFKFAWGELPSPQKLTEYLGPRLPGQERADHWSCYCWPIARRAKGPSASELRRILPALQIRRVVVRFRACGSIAIDLVARRLAFRSGDRREAENATDQLQDVDRDTSAACQVGRSSFDRYPSRSGYRVDRLARISRQHAGGVLRSASEQLQSISDVATGDA